MHQKGHGGAALIADDDEFFRMALRAILRDRLAFTEIIESQSFDEAVELLSSREDGGSRRRRPVAVAGKLNREGARVIPPA